MDHSTMLSRQTGNRASRSQKVFQRAYIACLTCRKTKSKCEASDDVSTCVKCKREQRQCIFRNRRSAKERESGKSISSPRPAYLPNETVERRRSSVNSHHHHPRNTVSSSGSGQAAVHTGFQVLAEAASYENHVSLPSSPAHTSSTALLPTLSPSDPHGGRISFSTGIEIASNIPTETPPSDLEVELMQTVVSSSQDALRLLFKAAAQQDTDQLPDSHDLEKVSEFMCSNSAESSSISMLNFMSPPQEVLDVWKRSHFVRLGWISPREAVAYIDLFFANLSHLSLVTNVYFSQHENHRSLVFDEPLLCSTLLMISSRYHPLVGSRAASRSHYVHDSLWRHIQNLIHRLTFGGDVHLGSKSRTLGCVEALLLLTEWHPRALAFSQFSECDGGAYGAPPPFEAPADDDQENKQSDGAGSTGTRWREEVLEPAKRADRMSWMMLGIASSLAHELGVYDEYEIGQSQSDSDELAAKQRLRRLLYLNMNQLALTLGCTSFLPPGVSNVATSPSAASVDDAFWEGEKLIHLWIDLTSLLKMVKGFSFSGRSSLKTGAYDGMLDHFQPLLNQWYGRFQSFVPVKASSAAVDLLFLDYQYVRMYVGSVGIQALVEGINNGNNPKMTAIELLQFGNRSEYRFTKEVLDASMLILSKTVSLARSGVLRFSPTRIFFRITSACVFLLKALGLGALRRELTESLDLLDQVTEALASLASDDAHPWGKYAVLIQRYAMQFRQKIGPSAVRTPAADAPTPSLQQPTQSPRGGAFAAERTGEFAGLAYSLFFDPADGTTDDWLMEPWDMWMPSADM